MKFLSILTIASASIFCFSCSPDQLEGNGVLKVDTLKSIQGPITAIKHNSLCEVLVYPATTPMVVVSGDENLLPLINVTYDKNTVSITNKEDKKIWSSSDAHPLTVKIYTNTPEHITLAGMGNIIVDSANYLVAQNIHVINSGLGNISMPVHCNNANVVLNGMGNITLNGIAQNIELELKGAGNIDAEGLTSKFAKIVQSGAGNISINTAEQADVKISGVGNVNFVTAPKDIKSTINGLGTINYDNEK